MPSAKPQPTAQDGPALNSAIDPHERLITLPLRSLVQREAVTLGATATVVQAARRMRDERVSSLLIVDDASRLLGIVTDRDLRNRVVAAGLDIESLALDVATAAPLTLPLQATAFDALLLMARHNVHHVPVMDGARVAGMVSATDIAGQQRSSAVLLAGEIHRQGDIAGLQRVVAGVRALQAQLAAADATAHATGLIVTAVTDALTTRLIQLAEARLGPPPLPYAWVAAGSQARGEQTARSDQDNCLVLGGSYDDARHGDYFEALSRQVCSGLDACGYVFCPGEMMAMTDTWRQPRARWAQYFRQWTDEPDAQALMLTGVFFDLRCIHGDSELLAGLRRETLRRTQASSIFQAHLARAALARRPPLGLFGRISAARSGPQRGTVDLKLHGIAPIVDLARCYALADGLEAVNTRQRLAAASGGRQLSEQGAADLRDALEYLSVMRIRHQVRQTQTGQLPDNQLGLDELSNFERTLLRDAFKVVAGLQEALTAHYQLARF